MLINVIAFSFYTCWNVAANEVIVVKEEVMFFHELWRECTKWYPRIQGGVTVQDRNPLLAWSKLREGEEGGGVPPRPLGRRGDNVHTYHFFK
jgi:hypothetical protein